MCVEAATPTQAHLEEVFRLKYGDPQTTGWGPRMRWRFAYFTPDEFYEAVVDRLVQPGTTWLDVGCGHDVFPHNQALARRLADRCRLLVGVDEDPALEENEFVHERIRSGIADYRTEATFQLVTLRMVAEHIGDPEQALAALARLTQPGGKVVVYTVNRWAPAALAAQLVPFRWHHAIKEVLWGTEEKDTFPVVYGMNTRRRLARLFAAHGFQECCFRYLDDCRSLGRWRFSHWLELSLRRLFRGVGLAYPENCLLGVYERR